MNQCLQALHAQDSSTTVICMDHANLTLKGKVIPCIKQLLDI